MSCLRLTVLGLCCLGLGMPSLADDTGTVATKTDVSRPDEPLPANIRLRSPVNIDQLRAMQKQVQAVVKKVSPCTVGIQIGGSAGSGVIISPDGYVLTAGHVSGKAGQTCTLILSDGRRVKAKTLGANNDIDSGLIKITEEGTWPYADLGDSKAITKGMWCVSIGPPGGYQAGRTAPVCLGRVQNFSDTYIQTDCTLVGGDSGGPLFDMDGRVIGIHSRIGPFITSNIHVPVETYKVTWDRLAKGEVWGGGLSGLFGGGRPRPASKAWLGIAVEPDAKDCRISEVTKDSPAEKAGLKVDDVITKFDGKKVTVFEDLAAVIKDKKVGDKVDVDVKRGMEVMTLKVTLTKRTEE